MLAFDDPSEAECEKADGFNIKEEVSWSDGFDHADRVKKFGDANCTQSCDNYKAADEVDLISNDLACSWDQVLFAEENEAEVGEGKEKQNCCGGVDYIRVRKEQASGDDVAGVSAISAVWNTGGTEGDDKGKRSSESRWYTVVFITNTGYEKEADGGECTDKDITHGCVVVSADGVLKAMVSEPNERDNDER